jgi:hypothetical protein
MKKYIFSLVVFTLYSLSVLAQTIVTENIMSNTTWTKVNSPYIVDYIEVETGVTLTIEPGTVVKLIGSVTISGTIEAEGTSEEKIVFTSVTDDEYGGDSNNDGDGTTPFPGEWFSIFLLENSGSSSFNYCHFRYGGSYLEIGAIDLNTNQASIENCLFEYCSTGIKISVSNAVVLNNVEFNNNEVGLVNNATGFSIHNSTFVNNSDFGIFNFSASDVDATLNWWGIEDFLIGNDNNMANLASIYDQLDDAFYGKVNYFPMADPPLSVESISPGFGIIFNNSEDLLISGYLFDEDSQLYLEKNGVQVFPTSVNSVDSFYINATFTWDTAETGLYDVVVVNPSMLDTLRLNAGFSLLDVGETPFNEWTSFEVTSGTSFASSVVIPEVDNLFVFMKKSTRIGYSSTWNGTLRLTRDGQDILLGDNFTEDWLGDADIDYNPEVPEDGFYTFEITTSFEQGRGQILFTDSPPELSLGSWATGEILRPYGYDWKKVEVPAGQDNLFIRTEGFGLWSTIEVFLNNIDNPDEKWLFSSFGSGYHIEGQIEFPPQGTYYVRYKDSAVLQPASTSLSYDEQFQRREYLIYVDTDGAIPTNTLPLEITGQSIEEAGQGIISFDIYGSGFSIEDSIYVSKNGSIVGPLHKVFKPAENIWSVTFDLSNAETGDWNVSILNGVTEVVSPYLFTLVAPDVKDIEINVVTSHVIRVGRWRPFIVELTNSSNTDAQFVFANIALSGNPEIRSDLDLQSPDILGDGDIDWTYFGTEWTSWDDVPVTFETLDSVTGIEYINLPVIFPYIKAGETVSFEINLLYDQFSYFKYKVTGLNSMLTAEASDYEGLVGGNAGLGACLETIGELFIDVLVDALTNASGLKGCAADISQAYTTTIAQKALANGLQKPYPVSAVYLNFIDAIAGCTLAAGVAIIPAAKVIKALRGLIKLMTLESYRQRIVDDCFPPPPPVSGSVSIVNSTTPEDKYGLIGAEQEDNLPAGERQNFISRVGDFDYRIDYWNKEDATAPAAEVFIRDTLDAGFDLNTFNFTEIGFLDWVVPLDGGHYFNILVDMRPQENYFVNVEGHLNPLTREVYWVHRTLDPETLELPDDPFAGYLPPIDPEGYNIGWVNFSIQANEDLPSETIFTNQAHVNFDGVGPWGPAPPYGPYTNTYDFDAPESSVMMLDNEVTDTTITLSWMGEDGNGAGIAFYDIYVSENGAAYELWLPRIDTIAADFSGTIGSTYQFYSIATDKVGNIEEEPDTEDASTSIITNSFEPKNDFTFKASPNPFSNNTTINFYLPSSDHVFIEVIDVNGVSSVILNKEISSGRHDLNWTPQKNINGIYFCRLSTSQFSRTIKLIQLK